MKIFIPTPPNISFPITIPNDVAITTCHKGIDGGKVKGIKAQVTKNPSEIGLLLKTANNISQKEPEIKVAAKIGSSAIIPI